MDFQEWISHPKNADLLEDLNGALREATKASVEHDKPASITLSLGIKSAAHGELGTVIVVPELKTKLPSATRSGGVWFVTEDFGLSRSNPSQLELSAELPPVGEAIGEIPNDNE